MAHNRPLASNVMPAVERSVALSGTFVSGDPAVSGRLADFTVITAEDPRTEDVNDINAEIAAGVSEFADERAFTVIVDRAQAIQQAVDMAEPGDVVAAFGKGHELSMCFGAIEYPWSDQQALADALEIIGNNVDR